MEYIAILTIAGSDSCGGAGIQADLKTFSALGCYGSSVITAVTAQNTCKVKDVFPLPASVVEQQIKCVAEDIHLQGIKIGMVNQTDIIDAIQRQLKNLVIPIVFDPVMRSSKGQDLLDQNAISFMKNKLIPLCTLVTPNLPETEVLSGRSLSNEKQIIEAAKDILQMGCQAVLIKGGHRKGSKMKDVLVMKEEEKPYFFTSTKVDSLNTHGTGCTLSAAITAFLAQGESLPQAVKHAKNYLTKAIKAGKDVKTGQGTGPLNHFFSPKKLIIR